jgi:hypothetical protein
VCFIKNLYVIKFLNTKQTNFCLNSFEKNLDT